MIIQDLPGVGKTGRAPETRASELDDYGGEGTTCFVSYSQLVGNCTLVESRVHDVLKSHRMDSRELFKIDAKEAARIVKTIAADIDHESS